MTDINFKLKDDHILIQHLKKFNEYEEKSEPAKIEATKILKTIKRADMRKTSNKVKIYDRVDKLTKTKNCDLCDTFQQTTPELADKWFNKKKN